MFLELVYHWILTWGSTICLLIGAVIIIHLWTVRHHNAHKTANWTLLQLCNYLCVFLFFTSIYQLFRWSKPSHKPHAGWGIACLFSLVYFFSIFGVWFVHALLLVGEDADELDSDLSTNEDKSSLSGSIDQTIRDLRVTNERLSKGMNEDDIWGVIELLWRLTNSGSLTVDLIRDTKIGRSLGGYCKRTCGRCNSPDCDSCELIGVWKQMVWESTTKNTPEATIDTQKVGNNEKRSPLRSSMHRVGSLNFQSLPSIPEFREHTNSTESINSELEHEGLSTSRSEPSLSTMRYRSRNSQRP